MAYTLINVAQAANGGNPDLVTTPSTDFTGADFFIVAVASTSGIGIPVVTDSLNPGANWSVLGSQTGDSLCSTHMLKNAISGATQTFSAALTGGDMAMIVFGFSGSDLADPYDAQFLNTNGTDSSFDFTATIIPAERNTMSIVAISFEGAQTPTSITQGFAGPQYVPYVVGESFGCAMAWKALPIPELLNPRTTFSGSINYSARLEIFLSAENGSSSDIVLMGDGLS